MLALIVGGLYLGGRLLGLGVLSTFLSRPILVGFFAGISLSIITGQLKRVTGAPITSDGLLAPFVDLARQAADIHWPSLALAAAMFAVLQAARRLRLPVPGPVIVVVLAAALSALLDLPAHGIATVGDIPSGVPCARPPRHRRRAPRPAPPRRGRDLPRQLRRRHRHRPQLRPARRLPGRRRPRDARLRRRQYRRRPLLRLPDHRLGLPHRDQRQRRRPLAARRRGGGGGAPRHHPLPAAGARASCRSPPSAPS